MAELFSKWKQGLGRTRKVAFGKLATLFNATEITSGTWEELEALLIQADLGIDTTQSILKSMEKIVSDEGITQRDELRSLLRSELISRLDNNPGIDFSEYSPAVILFVGVNGSGKTTTMAKFGKKLSDEGKKVLLAAGDTYRAAAVEQLQTWGQRINIPVIAGQPGGDPGAVTFDAVQSGIARKMDFILVDTAGRLHTRYNLMEELRKVHRVSGKALPGAPHATWLILDATTGQNALQQAKAFKEAVNVTGIILAKLDSSAKGGMVFAIQEELGLPILFAGLGEKPEDLVLFDRDAFVDGVIEEN